MGGFQIECSSIIDYSQKIITANNLDHSKFLFFVRLNKNVIFTPITNLLICILTSFKN